MRGTVVFDHVSVATRTSAGTGSLIYCGSYESGQLVVRVVSLGGAGAYVRPYWQSSTDGSAFGDFLAGATIGATGIRIVSAVGGIGAWCRCRWAQSGTGLKFGVSFVLSE